MSNIIDNIIRDISSLKSIDNWNYIKSERTLELALNNLGVGYLYIQFFEDTPSYIISEDSVEIGSRSPYIQIHKDYVEDFRITEESLNNILYDLSKIVNDVEDGRLDDLLNINSGIYKLSLSRAGIIYKSNINQEFIDLNIISPGNYNPILRLSEYFEVYMDKCFTVYSTAEIISMFKGERFKVIDDTFPHSANIIKHEDGELWISSGPLNLGECEKPLSMASKHKIGQYLEKNINYGRI